MAEELDIAVDGSDRLGQRQVSALLQPAEGRRRGTLVFGHGAGADMRHRSMEALAAAFAGIGLTTMRFNFPFKEAGASRVDSQAVSTGTIAAALSRARDEAPGPYWLGGHSFGGRMASHAVVEHRLDVAGLVFCSFPLHGAGRPGATRADHLGGIAAPMLFLSGSRDAMAEAPLLEEVAARTGATLRRLDDADHGYKTRKRSRTRSDDVFEEIAKHASAWLDGLDAARSGR